MGSGPKERNTLYLRLPITIVDQHQILELHPNISVVHLPRQKSRRWCTIEFEDQSKLEEARKELKKLKINGKFVKVKLFKKTGKVNKKPTNETEDLKKLLE